MTKLVPIRAKLLLEKLNSEILKEFANLKEEELEAIRRLFRIFAEIEKDKLLYLSTTDPKQLVSDVAHKQGEIEGLRIFLAILEGAKKELIRREKKS